MSDARASLVPARPPIALLGVPFDNITIAEALDRIEAMVASRKPHYLVTPNVDFLVQAQADIELHRILLDADLVLCDGTPLVWASRLLGNPLPERVAGADLTPRLIEVAARKKYRLFLLGATPASSEAAVARMRARFPELIIAGHYSPPFRPLLEMAHDEIRQRILEAQPDILLVSFGCPKQEKWIAMHYRELGVPVTAGLGATIDFLAGRVRRAPPWMQRTGTEWLFRLAQEPRRLLRRYAKDLCIFSRKIYAQWWRFRSRHRGQTQRANESWAPPSRPESAYETGRCFNLPNRLDITAISQHPSLLDLLGDCHSCFVEMPNVSFVDSTGLGLLLQWRKQLRRSGAQLVLVAPSAAVTRALSSSPLPGLFLIAPDVAAARRLSLNATLAPAEPEPAGLRWRGEISAANAKIVGARTWEVLSGLSHGAQAFIDVSAVPFLDSSGLDLMVRAKRHALEQGAKLLFTGVQPAVRNVLRLARMEDFLLGDGLAPQPASRDLRRLNLRRPAALLSGLNSPHPGNRAH